VLVVQGRSHGCPHSAHAVSLPSSLACASTTPSALGPSCPRPNGHVCVSHSAPAPCLAQCTLVSTGPLESQALCLCPTWITRLLCGAVATRPPHLRLGRQAHAPSRPPFGRPVHVPALVLALGPQRHCPRPGHCAQTSTIACAFCTTCPPLSCLVCILAVVHRPQLSCARSTHYARTSTTLPTSWALQLRPARTTRLLCGAAALHTHVLPTLCPHCCARFLATPSTSWLSSPGLDHCVCVLRNVLWPNCTRLPMFNLHRVSTVGPALWLCHPCPRCCACVPATRSASQPSCLYLMGSTVALFFLYVTVKL
jgi:hypothetical protein